MSGNRDEVLILAFANFCDVKTPTQIPPWWEKSMFYIFNFSAHLKLP